MKSYENRFEIEQQNYDYLIWKKQRLMDLGLANDVKITTVKRPPRPTVTGQFVSENYTSYKFQTKSLFKAWHRCYVIKQPGDPTYDPRNPKQRRKYVIPDIKNWFTHPLSLAVFYMDDGSAQNNQPYFSKVFLLPVGIVENS